MLKDIRTFPLLQYLLLIHTIRLLSAFYYKIFHADFLKHISSIALLSISSIIFEGRDRADVFVCEFCKNIMMSVDC